MLAVYDLLNLHSYCSEKCARVTLKSVLHICLFHEKVTTGCMQHVVFAC